MEEKRSNDDFSDFLLEQYLMGDESEPQQSFPKQGEWDETVASSNLHTTTGERQFIQVCSVIYLGLFSYSPCKKHEGFVS